MSDEFEPLTDTEEMRKERPTPKVADEERMRKGLHKWFEKRMPEARELGLTDFKSPEASGMSNITLLFDLNWFDDDGREYIKSCVARVKPPISAVLVFEQYDMSLQYKAMEAVTGVVPVPKLLGLETDKDIIGADFYIMERLEGRVPPDIPPMHMDGWVKRDIGPAEREKLWWNGVSTMSKIHKVDWREKLGCLFDDSPSASKVISRQFLSKMERYMEWAPEGLPVPEYRRALQWLHDNCDESEPMGLCWGDARMGNTMFSNDGCDVVALFDWEMVDLAHPVKDLAWWCTLDQSTSTGIGVDRLEGFPSVEETIKYWEKESGCSAKQFNFYKVVTWYYFGLILIRTSMAADNPDPIGSNFVTPMLKALLDELGAPPAK